MKQDHEGAIELAYINCTTALRILVCDKNPADRWLIGFISGK